MTYHTSREGLKKLIERPWDKPSFLQKKDGLIKEKIESPSEILQADQLIGRGRQGEIFTPRPIALVYSSSWADYDATTWQKGEFYKDADGMVHVEGLVEKTTAALKTANDVIATLPVGYRPARRILFSVPSTTGSYASFARVDVRTDVTITWQSGVEATSASVDNFTSLNFVFRPTTR